MTKDQVDELLMAINALVDNAPSWSKEQVHEHATEIQRMAANLPRLHELAVNGWLALAASSGWPSPTGAAELARHSLAKLGAGE